MSAERERYALTDWMVEKREGGWYFSRYRDRRDKAGWRGPYRSEASVAMMIARQLRREITQRHRLNGGAP
jgi:Ribonuclease G/E